MWERVSSEVKHHCEQCSKRDNCEKHKCVIFRIKELVFSIFDPSEIHIDDFFESEATYQVSMFDDTGGGEI